LPAYRREFLIQKSAGGGLSYKVKKYPRQSLICLRYLLDNMNNYIIPDT